MIKPILVLPNRGDTRAQAEELAASLGNVAGFRVVVDARATGTASSSFVDQFVQSILVEGGATSLVVVGASEKVRAFFESAAHRRVVSQNLVMIRTAGLVGRLRSRAAGVSLGR